MPIDFCKSSPEAHLRPHIGSGVQIISTNFFSLFRDGRKLLPLGGSTSMALYLQVLLLYDPLATASQQAI